MIDNKKNTPLLALLLIFVLNGFNTWAQQQKTYSSSEVKRHIESLKFLGSALYFAAHPDDENTRLIAYLANYELADVAYLSLTRGDGGQNLIGTEIREGLGMIRSQELLQARRTDGGQQFFSTANDFGYSKNPTEAFSIWDKEKVLSDAVWVIRNFQPDIIINRFDHRTPGTTHGHHTGSAMVSFEAFDLAASKEAFTDQLKSTDTWQAERLFWNTYSWGRTQKASDHPEWFKVDVGSYIPQLGLSVNEISALSRSQHKSQGFGALGSRGSQIEFLELIKGKDDKNHDDPFAGINTSWSRVEGAAYIEDLIDEVLQSYDMDNPSASLDGLLRVHAEIEKFKNTRWGRAKLKDTEEIILEIAGIYAGFRTDSFYGAPGSNIEAEFELVARQIPDLALHGVSVWAKSKGAFRSVWSSDDDKALGENQTLIIKENLNIPDQIDYSNAYWLNESWSQGNYSVFDYAYIGKGETPSVIKARFDLQINGRSLSIERDLKNLFRDPVRGEVVDPFQVVPKWSVKFDRSVEVFASDQSEKISVRVQSLKSENQGMLQIDAPKGWKVMPEQIALNFKTKGEEKIFDITVIPPKRNSEVKLSAQIHSDGKDYRKGGQLIVYDHIPKQMMFTPAEIKLSRADLKKEGNRVAYIMGAGDLVPEAIEQMGYQVDILQTENLKAETLEDYDAVVLGVRSLNVIDGIDNIMPMLFDYSYRGGNLIVQYNTSRGLKTDKIGPYPLELSRLRVTDENSELDFINPKHRVLNFPNKISSMDFQGWVQERGLYFPDKWDANYESIIQTQDQGESPLAGGLLIAKYGKGYFVYTSYSWFRELPAGVTGAYRIFANILSLNQE